VLGTVRVLLVAPAVGPVAATLAEIPLMLWICWLACGRIVARFAVPAPVGARIVMGTTAFVVLMAAEVALAVLAFGRTPATVAAGLVAPDGAIGLAAQLAFAAFPLIRGR